MELFGNKVGRMKNVLYNFQFYLANTTRPDGLEVTQPDTAVPS